MITRAWGTANGADIIFTRVAGDVWEVDVPWTEDGEYIVEVHAENESGNTAYVCTVLIVIAGHELRIQVVPTGFEAGIVARGFSGTVNGCSASSELEKEGYTIERIIC